MEKQILIPKIQQLLLHTVREISFYDRATDHAIAPELKSAFAKYLWLRGEHILGLRSFLIDVKGRVHLPDSPCIHSERFWRFFLNCVSRKDNPAILQTGLRYVRITLNKYTNTIPLTTDIDQTHVMLHNQLFDIQNILKEFSEIRIREAS